MKFIREAWNTGIPQLLLLLHAAWIVLWLTQMLIPGLEAPTGVLSAHSVQDFALSAYFTVSMAMMVYLSASGATRMRTFFEAPVLKDGSWLRMLASVAFALFAVFLVVQAGWLVRDVLHQAPKNAGPGVTETWSYNATLLMLGVWGLALAYRLKMIWDALTKQVETFESARWSFGGDEMTAKGKLDRFVRVMETFLASERRARSLDPHAYELKGETEDEVREETLRLLNEMPTGPVAAARAAAPPALQKAPKPRKPTTSSSRKSPPRKGKAQT